MNTKFTQLFYLIVFITLSTSCANYKINIAPEAKNWQEDKPDPNLKLEHRMYLVGDAGNAELGETTPVLKYLKGQLAGEDENSSIIYLGDNIYHDGMPPKSSDERELSEHRLNTQLEILDDFEGRPLFIPGNHDWRYGLKGLSRQEKYVEKYLNKGIDDEDEWENYFLPDGGCPGPEVIEVNDKLAIVIIDSQWWLADWDKEPRIHEGCENKNKFQFKFMFENAVRKHRSKNVVVAMHHPLYTVGTHGGKFPLKPHIFPLTEKKENLYIPLPGIGTLYYFIRGVVGSRQDVMHQEYKNMRDALIASVSKNGNYIFVSGHDHNLQYLENDFQRFIVSGSGSKVSPTGKGSGSLFSYGHPGFSTIEFYDDGQAYTQFWEVNEDGTEAKMVFQKKIKDALVNIEENIPTEFPEYESGVKTVTKKPTRNKISKGGKFQKAMLGQHYTDIYLQDYEFPVLDMKTFKGGVKPVQRGGGNQTNSLRVLTDGGQQYVFRDLTKDVSRFLPFPFKKMELASFIATDNFMSTHPFAPAAIPPMADAANIYHTNPSFYYIPKQPTLGVNNDVFGGSVYLVEERPGGNWKGTNVFGGPEKLIGTPDLTEKIIKNHNHKVDQPWTLRTRLFDFVIGDWDRHDDQWRWSRFEIDGKKVYRPIPRDRDQAFSKYDGFITRWVTLLSPFTRQLAVYKPEVGKIKWAAWSPRNFDTSFLNELTWEQWENEVKFIQENLTDEIVENAFTVWPEYALNADGDYIKSTLKKRRDNLMDTARRYFEFRSKTVDVVGTEGKDLFEVERKSDTETIVRVYDSNKDGDKQSLSYERVFDNSITKEIHIYGLGDDDIFKIFGTVGKSIKVRCVGGLGHDTFIDESKVGGGGKKTLVYDDKRKNTLQLGSEGADKRSDRAIVNVYDRRATHYEYGYTVPFPIIGQNPDDGFLLGASFHTTSYKFKKDPYGSTHSVLGTYAFATNSLNLEYEGDFIDAFGKWDLLLHGSFKNSAYAFNYFGYGNATKANFEENDIDFYRTRQGQIYLHPAFKKRTRGNNGYLAIGPTFERTQIEESANRFVTSDGSDLLPDAFDTKIYAGLRMSFNFYNVDNLVIPRRGVNLLTSLGFQTDFNDQDRSFADARFQLSFYQNLDRKENLIFATRWGFSHNFGKLNEDFEFWQAPHLGSGDFLTMRGYRAERFRGNTAYWQNVDLRLRLFSSYNRALPFTFGIFGGFDYGRVWAETEGDEGDTWHYDYGGGIWVAPVDALTLSFGLFQPKESGEDEPRFTFAVGFGF